MLVLIHARISVHDDVMKWKHFPRYWPFVRGIHRSPVNSLHKGQWRGALMFSLICALNKRLSKQSWGWLFETLLCSLWRHCNVNFIRQRYSCGLFRATVATETQIGIVALLMRQIFGAMEAKLTPHDKSPILVHSVYVHNMYNRTLWLWKNQPAI